MIIFGFNMLLLVFSSDPGKFARKEGPAGTPLSEKCAKLFDSSNSIKEDYFIMKTSKKYLGMFLKNSCKQDFLENKRTINKS